MLNLSSWLNNTSKARIKLPASILDYEENETLAEYTEGIEYLMVNVSPMPSAGYPGKSQASCSEKAERHKSIRSVPIVSV